MLTNVMGQRNSLCVKNTVNLRNICNAHIKSCRQPKNILPNPIKIEILDFEQQMEHGQGSYLLSNLPELNILALQGIHRA